MARDKRVQFVHPPPAVMVAPKYRSFICTVGTFTFFKNVRRFLMSYCSRSKVFSGRGKEGRKEEGRLRGGGRGAGGALGDGFS